MSFHQDMKDAIKVECTASGSIVSTDVGIASQILSNESIYSDNILDAKPNLDYAEKMISNLKYRMVFKV